MNELQKSLPVVAGPFEKVTYEQFKKDMMDEYPVYFELNEEELRGYYDAIKLPVRSTEDASGYDFHSPFPFTMVPGCTVKVPTGIRSTMDRDHWLIMCPRSGLGFKYHVRLANTIGNIDSDYYYSDNTGHIMLKIEFPAHLAFERTDGAPILFGKDIRTKVPQELKIDQGEKFAQGIFLPYGVTSDDDQYEKKKRTGGMGSSGRF